MKSWTLLSILVLVFILVLFSTGEGKETRFCLFNTSCTLSCNYTRGDATIVHWTYMKKDFIVHSFYEGKDQFGEQDPRFKNRTSLVEDKNTGNKTDLLLENVKVQDEGRYECYINSGGAHTTFMMEVNAPVKNVDMIRDGNTAICISEGVYPKPNLTWSSSPQSSSIVHLNQTEEKLYNIYGNLTLSGKDEDLNLSCTVSTRVNKRTTTWMKPIVTRTSSAQISCSNTNTSLKDYSLVWMFNQAQVIMTWSSSDVQYIPDKWKHHVEAEKSSDVLHLHNLSSDHGGTYSCELSRAKETTHTHTLLRVDIMETNTCVTGWALFGGTFLSLVVVFLVVWKGRDLAVFARRLCAQIRARGHDGGPQTHSIPNAKPNVENEDEEEDEDEEEVLTGKASAESVEDRFPTATDELRDQSQTEMQSMNPDAETSS